MIYEQIATGGCQSYLLGCSETCAAVVIDPEASQVDRYLGLAARDGLRIRYLIDTHTHADHFSGTRQLARQLGVPVVMHRESPAPFVDMRLDDGDMILVGRLRLQVITRRATRATRCVCRWKTICSPATRCCSAAPAAPICPPAIRTRFTTVCSGASCSWTRRSRCIRRTTTRAASSRRSHVNSPRTHACRSATAPLSST